MSEPVSMRREGGIAVITVDNPPVNALKNAVRVGLIEAANAAKADSGVAAVVIACAGRTFIAGADISEFGKAIAGPSTGDVIAAIEGLGKPTVAALHGTPLGGGFEVALGCHFRVAAPGTRMGLPEIKLGLIPGAGGTQRLPRLIGVERALAMILTGEQMGAKEALERGLVDAVVEGDVTAGAVAFARQLVTDKRPFAPVRERNDKLAGVDQAKFDELAAPHLKRARGLHAPEAAVAAIRNTLDLPFDRALAWERAKFLELVADEQSKAQRHIFFAEREAAKVADLPADAKPREIKRAAVIGAGTMGGGIAMCFANAGIPVTVIETADAALQRGRDTIARNYKAQRGLAPEEAERRIGLISGTTDMAAVADADIVVEAVFEEMGVKREVFSALERHARPDAVLATNTSYLDVDAIAAITQNPARVVGMHFFSPANIMRLLEVVRGAKTAPDVLATAIAVGRKLGKVPAVVGVCHGFVGNRMLRLRSVEAERLMVEGALPHEIDAALTKFGFAMGPLAVSDLAGLDISWKMRKAQGLTAPVADRLCDMGRFGQKTGKGFYRYDAGSRAGLPDPEVEAVILSVSRDMGVSRRPISEQEIVERLLFPMINEGARILEEKIARRPGDIDVIWVYGYGFPAWRGGPMHYADTLGLAHVRDRLVEFAKTTGDERHKPAALLARLAAEGKGFGN